MTASQFEVIESMETFVAEQVDAFLLPVAESWQPSDFLLDMNSDRWVEDIQSVRNQAAQIPDDLLVVLVGDMVTEEALPTYQTYLNRLEGVTDLTGVSDTPWARWSRGWTAEENRHGDLLNRYLYLTGRVDMKAVEVTIHYLIRNGFDPQTENDPYMGFIYTSFQEQATKIAHRNVATMAKRLGDENLHKICGVIAGYEARHERAYKAFISKLFEIDPSQTVLAFAKMMKKKITMPAHLMTDGRDANLFSKYSSVAQKMGVYTAIDYAEIIDNLVKHWEVPGIRGLSDVAAKAQDFLCTLSERYKKLADRISFSGKETFSWVFDREISLDYNTSKTTA